MKCSVISLLFIPLYKVNKEMLFIQNEEPI